MYNVCMLDKLKQLREAQRKRRQLARLKNLMENKPKRPAAKSVGRK
jgi:hypothetical protein